MPNLSAPLVPFVVKLFAVLGVFAVIFFTPPDPSLLGQIPHPLGGSPKARVSSPIPPRLYRCARLERLLLQVSKTRERRVCLRKSARRHP